MKVIIAFSGGKDSQACLIWAAKQFGAKNIISVFCDTKWENPITYDHINYVVNDLGITHMSISSNKYDGFLDLAKKKKRFPSTKARFCTIELKSKPMIDYVLNVDDNMLFIQGIRAQESHSRSQMNKQCTYFKYYYEPYGYDKKGKPKYHTYRKKDVLAFREKYIDDILRPVFDWSAHEVIDFIVKNGQYPNPLYKQGFSRVGCFPCIMSGHNDIKQVINRYPEIIEKLRKFEIKYGSSFFKPDYIPKKYCSGISKGIPYPLLKDVVKYINNKNATIDMFNEPTSCMSFYGLCE